MIRLAAAGDLPRIAAIYDAILTQEETTGQVYTNWRGANTPQPTPPGGPGGRHLVCR